MVNLGPTGQLDAETRAGLTEDGFRSGITVNAEACATVLKHIEVEREKDKLAFRMAHWAIQRYRNGQVCGTTLCLAGWTSAVLGEGPSFDGHSQTTKDLLTYDGDHDAEEYTSVSGEDGSIDIEQEAMRILGLPNPSLFYVKDEETALMMLRNLADGIPYYEALGVLPLPDGTMAFPRRD